MSVTFWESLKSIIPFTKESKRASEIEKEVDERKLIDDEIKCLNDIQSLIKNGLHNEAFLKLKEHAEDVDFSRFNKLKNQRMRKPSEAAKERNFLRKLGQRPPTPPLICNWTCTVLSGTSYCCTNECMSLQTKCFYHLKYCHDPDGIHKNKYVKIQIANKLGLCLECFATKESQVPVPIKVNRVPGVQRNV